MYNRVILVGRLTDAPDIRRVPGGGRVATFTLAVHRRRRDVETTRDLIDVIAGPAVTDEIRHCLAPGRWILVEGRLQIQAYTDRTGVRSWASQVVASCIIVLDAAAQTTETPPPDDRGSRYRESAPLPAPVQVPLL